MVNFSDSDLGELLSTLEHNGGLTEEESEALRHYSKALYVWQHLRSKPHNVCPDWLISSRRTPLRPSEDHKNDGWMRFIRWSVRNGYHPSKRLMRIIEEAGWHPENCIWVDNLERKFFKLLIERVRIPTSIYDYHLPDDIRGEAIGMARRGMPLSVVARALKLEPRKVSINVIKRASSINKTTKSCTPQSGKCPDSPSGSSDPA